MAYHKPQRPLICHYYNHTTSTFIMKVKNRDKNGVNVTHNSVSDTLNRFQMSRFSLIAQNETMKKF